jgi:FkbM family methyltransferase
MKLTRLGTEEGGWVVPLDQLSEKSVCYCVGAGEDISFDSGLVDRLGCQVHVFDPTPRAIAHVHKRLQSSDAAGWRDRLLFHAIGVYNENRDLRFYAPRNPSDVSHSIENLQRTEDYFVAECRTLRTIMDELGHDAIDLLKLDIEGAEHRVLRQMVSDGIRPRLLCVEFDTALHQPHESEQAAQELQNLVHFGYDILHASRWNVTLMARTSHARLATRWTMWKLKRRALHQQRKSQCPRAA